MARQPAASQARAGARAQGASEDPTPYGAAAGNVEQSVDFARAGARADSRRDPSDPAPTTPLVGEMLGDGGESHPLAHHPAVLGEAAHRGMRHLAATGQHAVAINQGAVFAELQDEGPTSRE